MRPITPAVVTATLFASSVGADGTAEFLIAITADVVVLYPKEFLDSILKL